MADRFYFKVAVINNDQISLEIRKPYYLSRWPIFQFHANTMGDSPSHLDEIVKKQNYEKLKEELLKKKGSLFKDDAFPHEKQGEYFSEGRLAGKEVKWLRPHDICKEPHFIEGGATRFDVAQGKLSDCWFIGFF